MVIAIERLAKTSPIVPKIVQRSAAMVFAVVGRTNITVGRIADHHPFAATYSASTTTAKIVITAL
jgi:hypothetical protein